MSFARILVPTDGSERGRLAMEHALELAKLSGGHITGLFVVDQASFMGLPAGIEWETLTQALRSEGERALKELREAGEAKGVRVETHLEEGHPAQRIIEHAKNADIIVMGTLGRTGLAHILLGSVAERVIRHAPCPVLVVRATP